MRSNLFTKRPQFKKRNILAVFFALLVLKALVQNIFGWPRSAEEPWSIGTLMLPGSGEVGQTFTLPVSGSFRIHLMAIEDGSIDKNAGTPFDRSSCVDTKKKPKIDLTKFDQGSPEMDEHYKKLSAYYSSQTKCLLDGQYGVLEIELLNISDNTVEKRLSSNMYHMPAMYNGKAIADFRRFDKGAELQITIHSVLSDSHKDREQIPYRVMILPNRLKCSMFFRTEGKNPGKCER